MCLRTCFAACACLLLVLAAVHGSASADEHPWSGAYVSVVSGAAQLEAADERAGEELESGMPLAEGDRLTSGRGGFVEIALRSGVRVWLDAATDVLLQRIFDGPALLLAHGALFVHVPAYVSDDVVIDIADEAASEARVSVRPGGLACVKLGSELPLVVDLWAGQAAVAAAGNSVSMYPAQRVRLGGAWEFLVSDFITEPGTRFEVQSLARHRRIEAAGRDDLDRPLQGIDELEGYGRWYYDSEFGARVWRPYAASGWRPFSNGRWLHHPRGVYWLAHDPWGGVTYHYGRWRYSSRGYWCWVPGYVFTPAAVRFYSSGDYLVWVPMGMHTRFTYGTWWPDDYYRYAVMCHRGSLYKARGRYCSGRHRGHGGCDDDRFERPRPGSRRDVKEVKAHTLPSPKIQRRLEAAPRLKHRRMEDHGEERFPREKLRPAPRMQERRQGKLQVVPAGERTTLPDERVLPPVTVRPRRSVESSAGPDPVFNPQPPETLVRDRDTRHLPGGVYPTPGMRPARRSFERPAPAESPPVFRTPQSGTGALSNGTAPRRQLPAYRPQPRAPLPEASTEPRRRQGSP